MHHEQPPVTEENGAPQVEATPEVKGTKLNDSQKEALIGFIEYLIETLTLKRVALLALLGLLSLFLFFMYENRVPIIQKTMTYLTSHVVQQDDTPVGWVLSDKTKDSLGTLLNTGVIDLVMVSEVDLKRNSRNVRYANFGQKLKNNPDYEALVARMSRPHSVFDYDSKNTAQMVAVLANEFRCDNFTDTAMHSTSPSVAADITTICRLAIPPFVGTFVGFITVGLNQKLTQAELDSVRLDLSRIAVEIYLTDVVKKAPIDP